MRKKRIRNISPAVQAQIIHDYKEKTPDGGYRYMLKEIADNYEISLSSVNNMARQAKCQGRPRGAKKIFVPSAAVMKILRDATEPFITLEEVGRRNPRKVVVNGKIVYKPLSVQRVSQIVKHWKERGNPGLRSKGFKPGDRIKWADQTFRVIRYDDSHKGAVQDEKDGAIIDPFYWVYKGSRSQLIPIDAQTFVAKE